MEKCIFYRIIFGFWVLTLSSVSFSYSNSDSERSPSCEEKRQFTFSWSMIDGCKILTPRGGSTKGAKLKLDTNAHPGWLDVQDKNINEFERDRRAILAMAGPYRTSFDFLEVVGYTEGFSPDSPYQSWGTEYVYVIEDTGDFISLQHIMVMFFEKDGEVSGPVVMKHWRQDWSYEKRKLNVYAGNRTWKKRKLSRREAKGTWAQAVYQVDDSPRYEATGRWEHRPNFSSWTSERTWRPLPRREYSVRNDYQVLEGTNRHTIVPTGWVHEQENYKLVIDENGQIVNNNPYLSKEIGLNRYERIIDFDFSAGDEYWKNTQFYWADVREEWSKLARSRDHFSLKKTAENQPLFIPLFEGANKFSGADYNEKRSKEYIMEVIARYLK